MTAAQGQASQPTGHRTGHPGGVGSPGPGLQARQAAGPWPRPEGMVSCSLRPVAQVRTCLVPGPGAQGGWPGAEGTVEPPQTPPLCSSPAGTVESSAPWVHMLTRKAWDEAGETEGTEGPRRRGAGQDSGTQADPGWEGAASGGRPGPGALVGVPARPSPLQAVALLQATHRSSRDPVQASPHPKIHLLGTQALPWQQQDPGPGSRPIPARDFPPRAPQGLTCCPVVPHHPRGDWPGEFSQGDHRAHTQVCPRWPTCWSRRPSYTSPRSPGCWATSFPGVSPSPSPRQALQSASSPPPWPSVTAAGLDTADSRLSACTWPSVLA